MPWKKMEVEEQRVSLSCWLAGRPAFCRFCSEFGISRPTGYLWLKRYRQRGVAGIEERSRRPRCARADRAGIGAAMVPARMAFPTGARANWRCCSTGTGLNCRPAPFIAFCCVSDWCGKTIASRPPSSASSARSPTSFGRWTSRGRLQGRGAGALSVIDDHSRYLVALEQQESTGGALVRPPLEQAFSECGVPEAMLMDHGIPWWGRQARSG